jgi:RNA polymerase sigma-70 factor (ECF subfamily)
VKTSRKGSVHAEFVVWYEQEYVQVVRTLALAIGDLDLAEECVAEAFARALARWRTVGAMKAPTGWVYTVAMNVARDSFRKGRAEHRWADSASLDRPVSAPEEPADVLWHAVAALAPQMRTAVALRYIADLPESEIARVMGIARGTVAATLHRARIQLAATLRTPEECT